jgi:hypothetical protein
MKNTIEPPANAPNRPRRTARTALTMVTLGGALAGASGCVIDDADESALVVAWRLQYTDGAVTNCAIANAPTVRVIATNQVSGESFESDFACAAGRVQTGVLPVGSYGVSLELLNPDGTPIAITDIPGAFLVDRSGLTVLPDVAFSIERLVFFLNWDLELVGGTATTCKEAGASAVRLSTTQVATGQLVTTDFPCDDLGGVTARLPEGAHSITVQLLDATGGVLSQTTIPNMVVTQNFPTDIGIVIFTVQSFAVSWRVEKAGPPGTPSQPTTCAAVGAASVELETQIPGRPISTFVFECATMGGITTAVPFGTYTLVLRLRDAAGAVLSQVNLPPFTTPQEARATLPLAVFVLP